MTDVAQVLFLPPPPPRAFNQALAPREHDAAPQVDAAAEHQARARRFRFRVYEGNEASDPNTRYDARRASRVAQLAAAAADAGSADALDSESGSGNRSAFVFNLNAGSGASSAFLAQSIAQEQLGEGLHNPPNKAATAAYTRTGAALNPPVTAGINVTA